MVLWWIGNLIFLIVVVPIVVKLLAGVLRPVKDIEKTAKGLKGRSASVLSLLDAVNDLPTTQRLVNDTNSQLGRYGSALDKIL
jgi:hypothetical protein